MNDGRGRSAVMGLMCAMAGVFVGTVILEPRGEGWDAFPVAAGLAGFGSGLLCWWLLVARRPPPSVAKGVAAGVAAAALAHYGTLYLLIVNQNIANWRHGTVSSLDEPPIDPIRGLVGAIPFTLFSYLFVGWITVPLGAAIGGFYARFLKNMLGPSL